MSRASQHWSLCPPALKNLFESNFKGFHEVNRITEHAGTARETSGIITLGEKDHEATLLINSLSLNLIITEESKSHVSYIPASFHPPHLQIQKRNKCL